MGSSQRGLSALSLNVLLQYPKELDRQSHHHPAGGNISESDEPGVSVSVCMTRLPQGVLASEN